MKATLRCAVVLAAVLASVAWAGPREEVNAAIDKFIAARSFHASMTMSGPQSMSQQLEFVAPGRYRMRMAGLDDQTIIGDTMFLNSPSPGGQGKSIIVPVPEGTLSRWRDPAGLTRDDDGMSVTALGDEPVGGVPAKKYRVDHTRPQPSTLTLWIGGDGYPLQIVSNAEVQGQPATTTIRYSHFNDPTLRVDPPQQPRPPAPPP